MIIEPIQKKYLKVHKELIAEGRKIFEINSIPKNGIERKKLVAKVDSILRKVPYPAGQPNAELVKGRFLSAVGITYGLILAEEFGWNFCEIHQDDESVDDGVKSVVSPDRAYFLYPIGAVYKEAHQHGGETFTIYEKIKRGDLPDVPPGAFLDLGKYIEDPDEALREISQRIHQENISATSGSHYCETSYQNFLSKWGSALPEDYLAFLKSGANLPNPDEDFFWVVQDDWGSSIESFFTMLNEDTQGSLSQIFNWKGIPLLPRMLPIGGDGSFGYVLMSFREHEVGSVYFCTTYSERGALREGGEFYEGQGYWKIAGFFSDFLNKLTENPDV
jgi:hypothetical protein